MGVKKILKYFFGFKVTKLQSYKGFIVEANCSASTERISNYGFSHFRRTAVRLYVNIVIKIFCVSLRKSL